VTASAYIFDDKMYAVMDIAFRDWLIGELEKRDWSQSVLARKAGISRQAVSDYVNQRRRPDIEALQNIAHAFHLPQETVFRIAGILPSQPGKDEDFEELKHLFSQMTEEEQEEFLATGRLKIELRNKRGELRETQQARPARA
jgi:transcriptional regulator with XRE-family HTH domain